MGASSPKCGVAGIGSVARFGYPEFRNMVLCLDVVATGRVRR